MIRTHILNWSQSCWNRKFETAVRFQPGQIPAVLCPDRVTTRKEKSDSGFWPVRDPNRTEPQVKTCTAGGLPWPIAGTTVDRWQRIGFRFTNILRLCEVIRFSRPRPWFRTTNYQWNADMHQLNVPAALHHRVQYRAQFKYLKFAATCPSFNAKYDPEHDANALYVIPSQKALTMIPHISKL